MTGNPTPVFAYLYDVRPGGSGTLISVAPYTFAGSQRPDPISFALEPIAWTIRAGHRLALVLDTVDPRWPAAAASSPSVITLGSGGSGPAALSVPAPS
jgi:predicted acyl esterase